MIHTSLNSLLIMKPMSREKHWHLELCGTPQILMGIYGTRSLAPLQTILFDSWPLQLCSFFHSAGYFKKHSHKGWHWPRSGDPIWNQVADFLMHTFTDFTKVTPSEMPSQIIPDLWIIIYIIKNIGMPDIYFLILNSFNHPQTFANNLSCTMSIFKTRTD